MFRRQLLRSSRALSQQAASSSRIYQHIPSSQFSSVSSRTASLSKPATSQFVSRRWQSTEAQPSEKPADGAETAAATEPSPADALKQEVEKKNKEVIELKDKYLRSVADYRNLQDRMSRDNANAKQFAIQKFATDLLDSIDNLDRALGAVPEAALGKATTTSTTSSSDANVAAATESTDAPNQDLVNLYNGLRMTETIMMQTLKKHGLEKFDPLEREGRKFDPNLDEATFFTPQPGKENGEVFYTQQKGYTLNGRVIRASKVGVVKNS